MMMRGEVKVREKEKEREKTMGMTKTMKTKTKAVTPPLPVPSLLHPFVHHTPQSSYQEQPAGAARSLYQSQGRTPASVSDPLLKSQSYPELQQALLGYSPLRTMGNLEVRNTGRRRKGGEIGIGIAVEGKGLMVMVNVEVKM